MNQVNLQNRFCAKINQLIEVECKKLHKSDDVLFKDVFRKTIVLKFDAIFNQRVIAGMKI